MHFLKIVECHLKSLCCTKKNLSPKEPCTLKLIRKIYGQTKFDLMLYYTYTVFYPKLHVSALS
jgi:hypothetical protein